MRLYIYELISPKGYQVKITKEEDDAEDVDIYALWVDQNDGDDCVWETFDNEHDAINAAHTVA